MPQFLPMWNGGNNTHLIEFCCAVWKIKEKMRLKPWEQYLENTRCYRLNGYVPPNSDAEILTPNVMVQRSGDFGKWWGHEVAPSWMGLVPFWKVPGKLSCSLFTLWGDNEKSPVCSLDKSSHQTQPCWHPDLRVPVSRAERNSLFISHPVDSTLLS